MKLLIKRLHPNAKMPTRGSKEAACFDLYVSEDTTLIPFVGTLVPTGVAMEIPPGHCVKVYGRSSMCKRNINVNVGIVDSDYSGEIKVQATYIGNSPSVEIRAGERIGQFMLVKLTETEIEETTGELRKTERGDKGWGSTGA